MKLTRLPLLLLALVVSFLAAPEAFGAKGKKSALVPSATQSQTDCDWYDIYCDGYWSGECCGDSESCLVRCDNVCGTPDGTCVET